MQPKRSACAGRQQRELTMNRRQTLGLLALVSMSGPALSQTASRVPVPEAERNHALRTLQAGSASLETSRVAISKGTAAGIKRFAQAESAEQQTLAQVLKARLGVDDNDKVAMPAEGKAGIDRLHDIKTGPDFDKAYVAVQIEGHRDLLQIQEDYLAIGKDAMSSAIARLARGHIREHLTVLEILQNDLAG
ncbi:DUF4142 domain-containing protein [Bosea sp. (in: a-proteobacteria)]|uniref:DUF4142 domain-containing protein n=1 Tax=Bosea sp. (in: a-proteobacteria) TaxID=1871050 RepID=UPI0027372289|nr:DUF4142 domain-containing protein [Bosea sp. (in: a-proteobacteria)]